MELLLLPLLSAVIVFFTSGKNAKRIALIASLFQVAITFYLLSEFTAGAENFSTKYFWFPEMGINWHSGYTATGMLLVVLTNVLVPIIILSGFSKDESNEGLRYGLILFMQFALVGVFTALNGFFFYVFWELALIPIYLICGIWGDGDKIRITFKFFLYTFIGSIFMLVSLIYLFWHTTTGSFEIVNLLEAYKNLNYIESILVSLGFVVAFAVKIPVFPLHTWQAETYTHAPAQGSMLLSGIMLKMGLYGVLLWLSPMITGTKYYVDILLIFSIIGLLYGGYIAIRQNDLKTIAAFASFSHVGLMAAGAFLQTETAIQATVIQMLAHGVNIVGLFYCIDIIQKQTGTRNIAALGGIASSAPRFAVLFFIIVLGTVAVPLSNGFVGEFLLLKSLFEYNPILAAIAGITVILCAVYMLRIFQRVIFGEKGQNTESFKDVNITDFIALSVLCAIIVVMGVYPQAVIDFNSTIIAR